MKWLFLLLVGLASVLSQEVDPTLPAQDEKSDRERYSKSLRASLQGQLDVIHRDLSSMITLEKHTAAVETVHPAALEKIDPRPLNAATPEDRLLRELKQANLIVKGKKGAEYEEAYAPGEDRPIAEPYKVAPRSLDPEYEATLRARMTLGQKPKSPPRSYYKGRLSNKAHYSTVSPGLLLAGKVKLEDATKDDQTRALQAAKAAEPKARRGDNAAEDISLALGAGDKAADKPSAASAAASAVSSDADATVIAATLAADTAAQLTRMGMVPFYEFYSPELKDHFYTTAAAVKSTPGETWTARSEIAQVFSRQVPGTVPLYLLWNKVALDHRYSLSAVAPAGFVNDGPAAFVYAGKVSGAVPLHEFYDAAANDHIYATETDVLMRRVDTGSLRFNGVVCYVLPVKMETQAASPSTLMAALSELTENTDVLTAATAPRQSSPGWPLGSGVKDKSMMDQMMDDPAYETTQVETEVPDAPVAAQGTKASTEASEGPDNWGSEPQVYPEVDESQRPVAAGLDPNVATEPPPNANTVDITSPEYKVPKVVAMYEYYNPLIRDHYYTTSYTLFADGTNDWSLVGPKFWVFDAQETNTVPLYRYWDVSKGDHYYTLTKFESSAYSFRGVSGFVFTVQSKDTVPLYRYYSSQFGDHKFSLVRDDDRELALGYVYEGVQCFVFDSPKDNLVPQDYKADPGSLVNFYRYFNSKTNHHFYTTSTSELKGDQLAHGWNSEGVVGRIHIYPEAGLVPLRRFWNIRTLNHYYTTRWMKMTEGWTYDGIQGYVNTKLVTGSLPLYRFYNAHLEDDLYTTDLEEIRQRNDRDSWELKGITCYVYSVEQEGPVNVHRYYNPRTADYFYTTSFEVFGKGKDGWVYQGTPFAAYDEGVRGTAPVHAYYHPINFDHLYTTKYFPDRKDGWVYHGIAYHAYPNDFNGQSQKLHRFFNPELHCHYYTTDIAEATVSRPGIYNIAEQDGWFYYGITAYVEAPVSDDPARGEPVDIYSFYSKATQLSAYSTDPKFTNPGFDARGVVFRAWARRADNVVPIYRYINKSNGVSYYDSRVLSGSLLGDRGEYEGPAFYAAKRAETGSVPLYRFAKGEDESITALSIDPKDNNGWNLVGIAGFVLPTQDLGIASNAMNIYQYYSPLRKEHFYTANWSLLGGGKDGWVLEGAPFRAHIYKGPFRVPVYDHFDASTHEHTYSTEAASLSDSRTSVIAYYLDAKKTKPDQLPLLAFKNPSTNDHIYTVSEAMFTKAADGSLSYGGVTGWTLVKDAKLGFATKPAVKLATAALPSGTSPVYVNKEAGTADKLSLAQFKADDQPAFYAFKEAKSGTIPLYEYVEKTTADRIYTTKWFKPTGFWEGGETAFFVLPRATEGAVPLYRFNNKERNLHIFTISLAGFSEVLDTSMNKTVPAAATSASVGTNTGVKLWTKVGEKGDFVYEGVQCYVFAPPTPRAPVFQLYNAKLAKHMYTTDVSFVRADWRNLGAKFWAYATSGVKGTVPALEYVNTATGTRELTPTAYKSLAPGFLQSAKAPFFLFSSNGPDLVPLHRYYNAGTKDNVYLVDQTTMTPSAIKGLWKYLEQETDGWKYEGPIGFVFSQGTDSEPNTTL